MLTICGYLSFIEKIWDSVENAGALEPTGSIRFKNGITFANYEKWVKVLLHHLSEILTWTLDLEIPGQGIIELS